MLLLAVGAACSPPAVTPARLEIASRDFGLVPSGRSVVVELPVRNLGELPARLSTLEADDPAFAFSDVVGKVVPAKGATTVAATFDSRATLREEHHATVTLRAADGTVATSTLEAVSAFIDCGPLNDADFAAAVIGETASLRYEVVNRSAVPSFVVVGAIEGPDARAFKGAPAVGDTLDPGEGLPLDLTYTPDVSAESLASFVVTFEQCPAVPVKLRGRGVPQLVTCRLAEPLVASPGFASEAHLSVFNWSASSVRLSNLAAAPSAEYALGDGGSDLTVAAGGRDGVSAVTPGVLDLPLVFTAAARGPRSGTFTASTSLPSQPSVTCQLGGIGGGPDIEVTPLALDLPPDAGVRYLTVRNVAPAADAYGELRLLGFTLVGPPTLSFGVPPASSPILSGESIELPIHASSVGDWELRLASTDPDEPIVAVAVHAAP